MLLIYILCLILLPHNEAVVMNTTINNKLCSLNNFTRKIESSLFVNQLSRFNCSLIDCTSFKCTGQPQVPWNSNFAVQINNCDAEPTIEIKIHINQGINVWNYNTSLKGNTNISFTTLHETPYLLDVSLSLSLRRNNNTIVGIRVTGNYILKHVKVKGKGNPSPINLYADLSDVPCLEIGGKTTAEPLTTEPSTKPSTTKPDTTTPDTTKPDTTKLDTTKLDTTTLDTTTLDTTTTKHDNKLTTSTKTTATSSKSKHSNTGRAILLVLAVLIIVTVISVAIYCTRKKKLSNQPAYYNDIAINDPLHTELDNDEAEDDDELPLFS